MHGRSAVDLRQDEWPPDTVALTSHRSCPIRLSRKDKQTNEKKGSENQMMNFEKRKNEYE